MKKVLCSILYLCLLTNVAFCVDFEGSVEARASAFFHIDNRFRRVFDDVVGCYGVEANMYFCEGFALWSGLDWCEDSRNRRCCKRRVEIINGNVGLKYFIPICACFEPYVGIGPSFARVWLRNKTCCERERRNKFAWGVVVKSGILYEFCDCYFADLFVDYLYQPVRFSRNRSSDGDGDSDGGRRRRRTTDVGGFKVGLGVGVGF